MKILKTLLTAAALVIACAGNVYAGKGGSHDKHDDSPRFRDAMERLPPDKAELVRATFKDLHADGEETHKQMQGLLDEIRTILAAPEFDRGAFIAAHDKIEALHRQRHAQRIDAIADLAGKLTAEERMILADVLKPGKHGFGKHRRHHRGDKGQE
jgi:uncharacterized membrane protein